MPEVHLLSNGAHPVMITVAGSGYSRSKGLAVTRWRKDSTLDNWGASCHLRDYAGGAVWSTTVQPTLQPPDRREMHDGPGVAMSSQCNHEIATRTEIAVSIDDDVELRRARITNLSERCRTLDATSYAEIVLAAPGTNSAHPAFSKLFIEAAIDTMQSAIFTTRRPSASDDPTAWLFHLALARHLFGTAFSYENSCFRTVSTSPDER
jgi:cyclic beta-1,2-glucan synthetase